MTRPETWIIDIDGCLALHHNLPASGQWSTMVVFKEAMDFLDRIEKEGATIILMTARKNRDAVEDLLAEVGVYYDVLITGVAPGARHIINDGPVFAHQMERNDASYFTNLKTSEPKRVQKVNDDPRNFPPFEHYLGKRDN